ncbi:MAG: UvrD-helicase domain-containing protein [Wolbachia endosymbiont of Fragariocoptes setiger]|nr:UvrD-helicase domain-containing protein [Wolbachia endosymbiont of Fragariocoptes setiger]
MRKSAIDPNFSVWVNASAGTGKTKILIDRVLKLLLENKKNILCLTFSNAAANEMETRIYNMLGRWATCSDYELKSDLKQLFITTNVQARKLFYELENINLTIQTIHAFCYKLISNFPIEAGITPNCTLSECKELHFAVFNKVLNHKTLQNHIHVLAEEIDENELKTLLYTLCIKRPMQDLEYIRNKINAPKEVCEIPSIILQRLTTLAEILNHGSKRDKNYSTIINNLPKSHIKQLTENFIKIFIKLDSYEKKNISSIITKSTLEKFPEAEQLIEYIQNTVLLYVKEVSSYKIFQKTSNLVHILKVYIELYNYEKLKYALLDYNDVIILTVKLLNNHDCKDWILYNLDQKIDHILVDEAQDNSIDQWKIISSLCDEFFVGNDEKRTLFVVGDVKQSIYRFQGADPILFNYMQKYFYNKTEGRNWLSCQLERSYRATPEILTFVDRIFNTFCEEVSVSNNILKHVPNRSDRGYVEIWPLIPKEQNKRQQAFKVQLTNEENYIIDKSLAQTIANKIHSWLSNGRILETKGRHIEPRDIIILIRQRNVLVDYIISELKKANIPVIGRDYFRIMDHIVTQDLVALAEFLLLQVNDLALANTLKSPLFNFSEEDLFNIAYDRKKESMWERLKCYSESTYSELNNLIDLSKKESPLSLFTHILRAGKKKFAARLGLECFEIIDEFMTLLLNFNSLSLQAFIQLIKETNPEIKINVQSECNAIKIMTIHKSKGLQAPIVFLVDTNTVPRNSDRIIFDRMNAPFWCSKHRNFYCDQVKKEKKIEYYNEYLCLLYVALTRAEDELYIFGKEPVQNGSWYDLITSHGGPYEKKLLKEGIEVLCINSSYPYIYKKHDYFDVPAISLPKNLTNLKTFKIRSEKNKNCTRGKVIHSILQYIPKIEKQRRKIWVKKYLENTDDKDEIYEKIIAFDEKYGHLEGQSEVTLGGMIDNKSIIVRLDRLCVVKDKVIIIDYKSHRNISPSLLEEIKIQMHTYKVLVQKIYPNKPVECLVIWIEDLETTTY